MVWERGRFIFLWGGGGGVGCVGGGAGREGRTLMKSWMSLKIVHVRVTPPWLLKKASVWLCHQYYSFNCDQIFLSVEKTYIWLYNRHVVQFWLVYPERANKVDMDKSLVNFENCPDRVIYFSVTTLWFLKMPIFDLVINIFSLHQIYLKLTY